MSMMSTVRVGEIYRHFKNQFVVVDAIGKHTETDEDMVIYHHLNTDHANTWVRPLSMWFDKKIDNAGEEVTRFAKMDPVNSIDKNGYTISYADKMIRQMDKMVVTIIGLYKTDKGYYVEYQDEDSNKFIISFNQMLEKVTDSDGVESTAFVHIA